MSIYDIKDKVVLVTGANRGIGRAFVERFLDHHGVAKVYAAVRSLSSADPLVERYGKDKVVPIHMDMQRPDSIEEAAAIATDVDVVVNNAGVLIMTDPLSEDAMPALEKQMETNCYGLVHIAQHFVPILERNGGGALVQINSTASLRTPGKKFWAYAASKHASYAVLQGLRASLKNTLVISVHPGPIATDMVDQFGGRGRSEPASQVPDAVVDAMKRGEFFVYPDSFSKKIGDAYAGFATSVIEPATKYTEA